MNAASPVRTPFIETFTGARFQPLSPVVEDIRIHDIAHALSNQCRFSGHVRHFYSVAEHCVRVSRLVTELLSTKAMFPREPVRDFALWGLLHDASEAYLIDLPTPLKMQKTLGDEYRRAEANLMGAVCKRFGLEADQPTIVTHADAIMLATEVRDLMFGRPEHWTALTQAPLPARIVPWSPKTAEEEFIRRFDELTIGRAA